MTRFETNPFSCHSCLIHNILFTRSTVFQQRTFYLTHKFWKTLVWRQMYFCLWQQDHSLALMQKGNVGKERNSNKPSYLEFLQELKPLSFKTTYQENYVLTQYLNTFRERSFLITLISFSPHFLFLVRFLNFRHYQPRWWSHT